MPASELNSAFVLIARWGLGLKNPQCFSAFLFSIQKQLPEVFCNKSVLKNFAIVHRKTSVLGSLFNKVAGLTAYNFIKKRFKQRSFILKNIWQRLFLSFCNSQLFLFSRNPTLYPYKLVFKVEKQPPEVLYKKVFLKILRNPQENTCARVSFWIKLHVVYKFMKKRLWHGCFPVNFAKFLRKLLLQNSSRRLFVKVCSKKKVFLVFFII